MDFTNINDPAGVQALLDQLRTSQAWQELNDEPIQVPATAQSAPPHASTLHQPDIPHSSELEQEPESSPIVSEHITSLLSQLQSAGGVGLQSSATTSSWTPGLEHTQHAGPLQPYDVTAHVNTAAMPSEPSRTKLSRSLNFNQALPIIARLSEGTTFMEKLQKLQADQAHLENKLWEARTQIIQAQEKKVQVEQAKALIIGTGLSQKDADRLRISFERELKEFDREQVLTAWDALIAKQQAVLEMLGVPGMFTTTLFTDREKQQRIVQVLEGLSDNANDDVES